MSMTHTVPFLPGYAIRVIVSEDTYVPAELSPDRWEHRQYTVTVTFRGRYMRVQYSQGMALRAGEVNPREVLHSIVSDAIAADQPFADFCNEFGYDEGSTEARRIYRACDQNFERIRRVFARNAREFYDMVNGWEL